MAFDVKITGDVSDLQKGLKTITSGIKEVQAEAKNIETTFDKAVGGAVQSLGEMKRELREIRNTSFTGKTTEEIKQLRARMAELTDSIGDFQGQIKKASADRIPALIGGLQGIVAGAQGVTATMALFGVENEKLEKTMVQLIGASQALNTVYDIYEKQTLLVAGAQIKQIATSVASSISTKVLTAVTTGATVAQKALNLAMLAMPIVAIGAGIAGLAYAIIQMSDVVDRAKKTWEVWATRSRTLIESLSKSTKDYHDLLISYNKTIGDFNDRNLTSGEKAKKQFLANAEIQKQAIIGVLAQLKVKNDLVKAEIEHAKAQYAWMQFLPNFNGLALKGIEELEKQYDKTNIVIEQGTAKYKEWSGEINKNAEFIKKNLDEVERITELEKESAKAKDESIKRDYGRIELMDKWITYIEEAQKIEIEIIREINKEKNAKLEQEETAIREAHAKRIESERQFNKTEEDLLNEKFKKGEIGWTEYEEAIFQIRLNKIKEYTGAVQQGLNSLGEITANLREMEQIDADEKTQIESENLDKWHEEQIQKAGNNAYKKAEVDKQYNEKKKQNEESAEARSLDIKRKYANLQKAVDIGKAISNGAIAVTGILASWAWNPIVAGLLIGLTTGAVATEVALISKQKYEKGGTGLIDGKSHRSGGTPFFGGEAEKNERWAIFSEQATARNSGLESMINAVNSGRLVINRELISSLLNGRKENGAVIINFDGGEDLRGMHEIMKRETKILPNGYVKKGIMLRRLN